MTAISGPNGPFDVRRINNAGYTVGYILDVDTETFTAAVRSPDGRISEKQPGSRAFSINDSMAIAGVLGNDAYIWRPDGTATDLGGAADHEITNMEINNQGVVAWSSVPRYGLPGKCSSFVWAGVGDAVELASLDTSGCSVFGINNAGQIVGSTGGHAVVWNALGSIIRDLGLGEAHGINGIGQVVGQSDGRAVLWNTDGNTIDLGLGESSWADAINDSGWIVGGVYHPDPETHMMGFLWQPVPEPSSLLALLAGLGGCGVLLRRRKR